MYSNNPEILEDGTEYYPPINSCSYDEHELDMYFIGDNYGKDEDSRQIYKSYYEETISLNGKAQDKNLEVVGSSPT